MVLGSFWRSRCCKSLAQLLGDTGPLMSIDCACGGPGHVGIPGRRRFCPGVSAVTPKVGEVLGMTQGDFGETILQTHTCVESSVAVLSVAEWLEGLARADQGMEESAPAGSLANAGRELTQNFLGPWQREREAANGVGSVSVPWSECSNPEDGEGFGMRPRDLGKPFCRMTLVWKVPQLLYGCALWLRRDRYGRRRKTAQPFTSFSQYALGLEALPFSALHGFYPLPSSPPGQSSQHMGAVWLPPASALWHGSSLPLWVQEHILHFLQCPSLAPLEPLDHAAVRSTGRVWRGRGHARSWLCS
ncbi:uncharacterized protein LOC120766093 isoform X1 [Hirundo rustica]|uniref:uncharacterized protein LOC120766093 isoform X1 n=1 Tax=Hirundo rustica TaxID=43150 RepID=UPI0026720BDE|nr:uncharacterized protein LOC120766093 isoform X1 [Hirundo rustica]XP_058280240.1 uncharacterized protein LOC120766093 isoform X1 [Hirundo rustica]XP_058280241.1 uncharacterized protein LOC120766093 isoform X1 [Hirundo rustica]